MAVAAYVHSADGMAAAGVYVHPAVGMVAVSAEEGKVKPREGKSASFPLSVKNGCDGQSS